VAQTVEDALRAATLYSDDVTYIMVSLPAAAITAAAGVLAEISEPFAALIADKDEVTLVLTADEAAVSEAQRDDLPPVDVRRRTGADAGWFHGPRQRRACGRRCDDHALRRFHS
jgi:hypothetical protein